MVTIERHQRIYLVLCTCRYGNTVFVLFTSLFLLPKVQFLRRVLVSEPAKEAFVESDILLCESDITDAELIRENSNCAKYTTTTELADFLYPDVYNRVEKRKKSIQTFFANFRNGTIETIYQLKISRHKFKQYSCW